MAMVVNVVVVVVVLSRGQSCSVVKLFETATIAPVLFGVKKQLVVSNYNEYILQCHNISVTLSVVSRCYSVTLTGSGTQ